MSNKIGYFPCYFIRDNHPTSDNMKGISKAYKIKLRDQNVTNVFSYMKKIYQSPVISFSDIS